MRKQQDNNFKIKLFTDTKYRAMNFFKFRTDTKYRSIKILIKRETFSAGTGRHQLVKGRQEGYFKGP